MKVKAIWEKSIGKNLLPEELINLKEAAKEMTKAELSFMLKNYQLSAEDFAYAVSWNDSLMNTSYFIQKEQLLHYLKQNISAMDNHFTWNLVKNILSLVKKMWNME